MHKVVKVQLLYKFNILGTSRVALNLMHCVQKYLGYCMCKDRVLGTIYGLYCPKRQAIRYIGCTIVSAENRFGYHMARSTKPSDERYRVHNWILSIVSEGYMPELVILDDEVPDDNVLALERWYVVTARDEWKWPLTNLTDGGDGVFGLSFSDESKRKMSDSQKIRFEHSPVAAETRQKRSDAMKGSNNPSFGKVGRDSPTYGITWNHTEEGKKNISRGVLKHYEDHPELREKLSRARTGDKHPNFGKRGEGTPMYGKKHSEGTKRKMREAFVEGKHPNHGKRPTEQTKRKMSKAQRGSNNPKAKLTEEQVIEIRKLYSSGDYTQKELCDLMCVSGSTIGSILARRSWKHI